MNRSFRPGLPAAAAAREVSERLRHRLAMAALVAACLIGGGPLSLPADASIPSSSLDHTTFAAQGRLLAVTVDDLPQGGPQFGLERMRAMTDKLVATFVEHGVPAVGFVNENKLETPGEEDERLAFLRTWAAAGLELGNHTYSHPSPHHIPLPEYFEDIVRGEPLTRQVLAEHGMTLRYFRHPFLRRGLTLEDKEAIDSFVAERGYIVAPVTMENVDYLYAAVYAEAKTRGDYQTMARVAHAYMELSERMFAFFEAAALELFGRPIAHVYLLHANELNADTFDRFAALAHQRGYTFVTLEEAIADPAYSSADRYAGTAGPSWMFRWDATQAEESGSRKVDWRAEPVPHAWVQEAFDNR